MDRVEYLTKAYIHSFNIALKEVGNPNLAAQIASAVLFCLGQEQHRQMTDNPMAVLMAALTGAETDDDDKGGKKK